MFYVDTQEELAFMFEMLGLKEDALIQYDELDAMFDQFVENFASGGKFSTPFKISVYPLEGVVQYTV